MDFFPKSISEQIYRLNDNLESLRFSINEFSKSSNELQKKLVFWTKVMAGAIIAQIVALVMVTIIG